MSIVLRWLFRNMISALIIGIFISAVVTIVSVVQTFANRSKESADYLALRVESALHEPVVMGDYARLEHASNIIFLNPTVLSFQIYRSMEDGSRIPYFARRTNNSRSDDQWGYPQILFANAIRPAFFHEREIMIISNGQNFGTITLTVLDHHRIQAATNLALILTGLLLFILTSLAGVYYWQHKRHTELLHILYRELVTSRKYASSTQINRLRQHPFLNRLHHLIRKQKKSAQYNERELHSLRQELSDSQAMLSKMQYDMASLKREKSGGFWEDMIPHTLQLTQQLAQRSRDPEEKEIINVIYQTLWKGVRGKEVSFPPHGEVSGFELTCALHQITCGTSNPVILFTSEIDFEQGYQGSIFNIRKAALILLDVATEHSLPDTGLRLKLAEDPASHKIVLICTLTSPTAREGTHFSTHLAQRKSFLSLQRKIERAGGHLKAHSDESNATHLSLALPLISTRKIPLNTSIIDTNLITPAYFIDTTPRAKTLCQLYQQAKLPIVSVSREQIESLEPGVLVTLKEELSVHHSIAEASEQAGHKLVTVTDADHLKHPKDKSSLMVIDIKTHPQQQMEQISLLCKENTVTSIDGESLPPLKPKSMLSHLIKRISATPEYEFTLWIPSEQPYLSEASSAEEFSQYGIRIKTYALDQLPEILPLDNQDSILIMASTLKEATVSELMNTSHGVIVLLNEETSVPDLSDLTHIRKIISLPIDTVYLTSIVMGAEGM